MGQTIDRMLEVVVGLNEAFVVAKVVNVADEGLGNVSNQTAEGLSEIT